MGALDLVPARDLRRPWPPATAGNGIASAHALEAALREVPRAAIGVIGRSAAGAAQWLQREGYDAAVFGPSPRPRARDKSAARSRRRPEVVLAVEWIEHEPNAAQALRSIRRMLGAEGRLIVVVPNFTHASCRLSMLMGRHPCASPRAVASTDVFTAAGIERLLSDAGFTVTAIERQVDSIDTLKDMARGVPGPVVDMLVGDAEALTSHFVFVALPESSHAVALLHRRVRELTDDRNRSGRVADRLDDRVAALEVRVRHWAAETDALAGPGVPTAQAMAALDTRVQQMGEQLAALTADRAAADGRETERDAALRSLGERLEAQSAEMEALIRRVEQCRYRRMLRRIQRIVSREVPSGATVAVVSRGDNALLAFEARKGWHFPQTESGVYAGHHPADSEAAIVQFEELRKRGARYLLFPRTAFWWLEHYRGFHDHLLQRHECIFRDQHTCALFAIRTRGR